MSAKPTGLQTSLTMLHLTSLKERLDEHEKKKELIRLKLAHDVQPLTTKEKTWIELFKLRPASDKRAVKKWSIEAITRQDAQLAKALDANLRSSSFEEVALTAISAHQRLIKRRLDYVFVSLIDAAKKRDAILRHGFKSLAEMAALGIPIPIRDVSMTTSKRIISMPVPIDKKTGKTVYPKVGVDYAVWHGQSGNLEMSCVVVRGDGFGDLGMESLVKAMAMIHRARKSADRDASIYGIATDSWYWGFVYIDNKCRYSRWFLNWQQHHKEIITQVMRILAYASDRVEEAYKTGPEEENLSEQTGCEINREPPKSGLRRLATIQEGAE